jgi:hypothetical protein
MKIWNKNPVLQRAGVDFQTSDWIYTPIIQSGGKYDLKVSAESNQDPLKPGVVLVGIGIKYKEYCSNIGRTFMVGPHKVSDTTRVSYMYRPREFRLMPYPPLDPRKQLPVSTRSSTSHLEEYESWCCCQGSLRHSSRNG